VPRDLSIHRNLPCQESILTVSTAVDEVAHARGSTPARVALAWLLARPEITAPIASATNEKQLADLAAATKRQT
jgi:aryl-alcohol dehydrogenase-like predicted oxidoreductase